MMLYAKAFQRRELKVRYHFLFLGAVLLVSGLLLSGCTLTLIGDYDDVIDKGMTDFQQKVETYLTKLENDASIPYDSAFYDDAYARLASMRSRAQASYKKDILVQQVDDLKATLDDFKKGDSKVARGPDGKINITFVMQTQKTFETEVESILKLELALKRGKDSPSGGK